MSPPDDSKRAEIYVEVSSCMSCTSPLSYLKWRRRSRLHFEKMWFGGKFVVVIVTGSGFLIPCPWATFMMWLLKALEQPDEALLLHGKYLTHDTSHSPAPSLFNRIHYNKLHWTNLLQYLIITPLDNTIKQGKRKMVEGFVRWCQRGDAAIGLSQKISVDSVEDEFPTGLYDDFYVQTGREE